MKNWSYTITEGPHKGETLWSSRYCAVAAFIFTKFEDKIYVLANKRGEGCPDFQGYWACPCGFLEANESGKEGCAREAKEETGIVMNPDNFDFWSVETDPKVCNKGHVTLKYVTYVPSENLDPICNIENLQGGEENEVSEIKWINISELDKYQWAFNHNKTIQNIYEFIQDNYK